MRRWGESLADDEVKVSPQPGRLVFSAVPGASHFFVRERQVYQLFSRRQDREDRPIDLLAGWKNTPVSR